MNTTSCKRIYPDHRSQNKTNRGKKKTRLARLGNVYPIGKSTGMITVAGRQWDLWVGMNGDMKVFSFLPPAGVVLNSFSTDVKLFFNHIQACNGYPASSQNLIGMFFFSLFLSPLFLTITYLRYLVSPTSFLHIRYWRYQLFSSFISVSCSLPSQAWRCSGILLWKGRQTDGFREFLVFQVGTEAFTGGPATFTVSQFSADVS